MLDYGSGNVYSALNAVRRAGAEAELTADRQRLIEADGLIVPGVGAFRAVTEALRGARADEIIDRRLAGGKAVLGICVGMQVLFERGIEGGSESEGLAQWPGSVTQLDSPTLPHMGWNTVETGPDTVLFRGLEQERFYFVHSYAAQDWSLDPIGAFQQPVLTWADYGTRFLAAVENGVLSATQFHPEKSGDAGIGLLRNWLTTL